MVLSVCEGKILPNLMNAASSAVSAFTGGSSSAGSASAGAAMAKKPEGWASVFREMTALQNEHEIEVTKLNQDFQMKYMKLQEKLSNNMSHMFLGFDVSYILPVRAGG